MIVNVISLVIQNIISLVIFFLEIEIIFGLLEISLIENILEIHLENNRMIENKMSLLFSMSIYSLGS